MFKKNQKQMLIMVLVKTASAPVISSDTYTSLPSLNI